MSLKGNRVKKKEGNIAGCVLRMQKLIEWDYVFLADVSFPKLHRGYLPEAQPGKYLSEFGNNMAFPSLRFPTGPLNSTFPGSISNFPFAIFLGRVSSSHLITFVLVYTILMSFTLSQSTRCPFYHYLALCFLVTISAASSEYLPPTPVAVPCVRGPGLFHSRGGILAT